MAVLDRFHEPDAVHAFGHWLNLRHRLADATRMRVSSHIPYPRNRRGWKRLIAAGESDWTIGTYRALWIRHQTLYYETRHWRAKSEARRALFPDCERCGVIPSKEAHHLHYDSVGNEDVDADLKALCLGCHDATHHRPSRASKWSEDIPL